MLCSGKNFLFFYLIRSSFIFEIERIYHNDYSMRNIMRLNCRKTDNLKQNINACPTTELFINPHAIIQIDIIPRSSPTLKLSCVREKENPLAFVNYCLSVHELTRQCIYTHSTKHEGIHFNGASHPPQTGGEEGGGEFLTFRTTFRSRHTATH